MTWNNIQWKLRMLMFDYHQILTSKIDKNISILCNNCIGAFVAHDFRLPFNSPTINLMIPPSDFIEYIANLEYYTNAPIEPTKSDQSWPIALLGGKVHIHLIHYKTVEEGVLAWRRRETRINAKRMYFRRLYLRRPGTLRPITLQKQSSPNPQVLSTNQMCSLYKRI